MIAQLHGTIIAVHPAHVVLDVHGVGYLVAVTHGSGFAPGSTATLHTYLAVRETALELYGFTNERELMMFHELIKLPKIGPKTALQILSQADIETLTRAVETQDATYLSKMSGIGAKSAEKIVSGLKEVFGENGFSTHDSAENVRDNDVMDALISLGYSQRDALQAVQHIPPEVAGTNERIKHALKHIHI